MGYDIITIIRRFCIGVLVYWCASCITKIIYCFFHIALMTLLEMRSYLGPYILQ